MSRRPVMVSGVGLTCAVGGDAATAAAAIRAGIIRFQRVEGLYDCRRPEITDPTDTDEDREPVVVAPVMDPSRPDRAAFLLVRALADLIEQARLAREHLATAGILLCARPEESAAASAAARRTLGLAAPDAVGVRGQGHAAMLVAAGEAIRGLQEGQWRRVIVAGADSHLTPARLRDLDEAGRLLSERNRDGFVPGEAASAFMLELAPEVDRRAGRALARISGLGQGQEPHPAPSREPAIGAGLCTAVQQAAEGGLLGPASVTQGADRGFRFALSDLNGESHRAREWAIAQVKVPSLLGTVRRVWHPADCVGDVGTATAGLLMTVAARAFARKYAPDRKALVWAASDDGLRAALTLEQPG